MKKEQTEKFRKYIKPRCKMIATEPELFICASVTLNAAGSSESNWGSETVHDADHDEWFGTMSEVAPAKGAELWDDED